MSDRWATLRLRYLHRLRTDKHLGLGRTARRLARECRRLDKTPPTAQYVCTPQQKVVDRETLEERAEQLRAQILQDPYISKCDALWGVLDRKKCLDKGISLDLVAHLEIELADFVRKCIRVAIAHQDYNTRLIRWMTRGRIRAAVRFVKRHLVD